MASLEQIGTVTTRSGGLIVIDTGYLSIWSHDQPPILPDGFLHSEDATKHANSFVDLRLIGSDAKRTGQLLNMSWNPFFLYDQPADHPEIDEKLQNLIRIHNLDTRFEVISPRIPHRKRIGHALDYGGGAGEIQFHGIWAAVVSGVPIDKPIDVLGERMPPPDQFRWKQVIINCNSHLSIDRSEKIGHIGVDYARLLVADFDVLGAWQHEDSLDGLADFIFWGKDAKKVAQFLNAPLVSETEFGWTNVPIELAEERGAKVEEYKHTGNLRFVTDYRPHSHHWQVMRDTRTSPTESGMAEINGQKVCNFMTTWGDGIFEVQCDLAKSGEIVQIRIEFGVE